MHKAVRNRVQNFRSIDDSDWILPPVGRRSAARPAREEWPQPELRRKAPGK